MTLLVGRLITLAFYGSALLYLIGVLIGLRTVRNPIAAFLIPLSYMVICYGWLVIRTINGETWEQAIPVIQAGHWVIVLAIVTIFVRVSQGWPGEP